jgi:hypothetical protein
MQEGHQRRLGGGAPGPTSLNLVGVRAPFGAHDVGVQAALEGRSPQSAQHLVAQIAAGQIDVVRLQQQCAFELLPPIPDGANGASDQA